MDGKDGRLFFDNMAERPIRGSTPWTNYTVEAHMPTGAEWLNYGILLVGSGQVWCDDLRLLVPEAEDSCLSLSLWDEGAYIGSMSPSASIRPDDSACSVTPLT